MGKTSSGEKFLRFQNPTMEEPKTRKIVFLVSKKSLIWQKLNLRLHCYTLVVQVVGEKLAPLPVVRF